MIWRTKERGRGMANERAWPVIDRMRSRRAALPQASAIFSVGGQDASCLGGKLRQQAETDSECLRFMRSSCEQRRVNRSSTQIPFRSVCRVFQPPREHTPAIYAQRVSRQPRIEMTVNEPVFHQESIAECSRNLPASMHLGHRVPRRSRMSTEERHDHIPRVIDHAFFSHINKLYWYHHLRYLLTLRFPASVPNVNGNIMQQHRCVHTRSVFLVMCRCQHAAALNVQG